MLETLAACPLCESPHVYAFQQDRRRHYLRCHRCALVTVEPHALPHPVTERREYELHDNDVSSPGYRRFLSRALKPIVERAPPGARGLDFGCGPGPALVAMAGEAGFQMSAYDPLFANDPALLEQRYAFVTCTEVVEHLHHPKHTWRTLANLLETPGWLVVMTQLVTSAEAFKRWRYKDDVTHVAFYAESTLRFVAQTHGLRFQLTSDDVALFTRR